MSRQLGALGMAVIAGVIAWLAVGLVGYTLSGCDEGPCPMPAWQWVVRWGVPLLVALIAGRWGARRADRTRRALDR